MGSFTTISHDLLMKLLEKKIEDPRFLSLIKAMLDAGYLEDWTYYATYSGVPQGSIVSPILANVYLHELDLFMKDLKQNFDQGKKRKKNPPYNNYTSKIARLRKKWDTLKRKGAKKEELQDIQKEIRRVDQLRKRLPCGDPFDASYKRLYYCRYADDFAIGIIGSQVDAENVRQEVKRCIQETLKLTIAEEKSHISPSKKGMLFVGYEVKTYSGKRTVKVKRGSRHTTQKSISERIQFHVPKGKLQKFCSTKRYGNYETFKALHKKEWTQLSDAEIILAYNGELRGLANYYARAQGVKREMDKLARLWWVSLLKTLASKHKMSVQKAANRLKRDDGYALVVKGEKKTRIIRIFRLKDLKQPLPTNPEIDTSPNTFALTLSRSELIKRLNAKKCEYCETTQGPFEVHVRRFGGRDRAHQTV